MCLCASVQATDVISQANQLTEQNAFYLLESRCAYARKVASQCTGDRRQDARAGMNQVKLSFFSPSHSLKDILSRQSCEAAVQESETNLFLKQFMSFKSVYHVHQVQVIEVKKKAAHHLDIFFALHYKVL